MSPNAKNAEADLILGVVNGSRSAFGALVEPHSARLITLATRMLGAPQQAEDAVQDALASIWLARHRLDHNRSVGPFLTTVVINKCRDRLRKRKVARLFGFEPDVETLAIADDSPRPDEIAEQREELRRLAAEIERLPIRLREALVLVSMDGRSQAEAATLLGVSEKAVETRIYRARKHLRERLEES